MKTPVEPWEYDREMYTRSNEVEQLLRRLKGFRRIFPRVEKLDLMFPGRRRSGIGGVGSDALKSRNSGARLTLQLYLELWVLDNARYPNDLAPDLGGIVHVGIRTRPPSSIAPVPRGSGGLRWSHRNGACLGERRAVAEDLRQAHGQDSRRRPAGASTVEPIGLTSRC